MDIKCDAPLTTGFSLRTGGYRPGSWPERSLSIKKPCAFCGKEFGPTRWINSHGKERVMKEGPWNKQACCSQSCAKKMKNPMSNNQARLKMKARLREIKHKPIKRGGNGQLFPLSQLALLHALGEGWEAEVVVPVGMGKGNGYPTCYKIDIANAERRIAIEVDGGSHCAIERREQDARKTDFLVSLGWSVFRVSKEEALRLYSTFTSVDILLTSLTGGLFTTAT